MMMSKLIGVRGVSILLVAAVMLPAAHAAGKRDAFQCLEGLTYAAVALKLNDDGVPVSASLHYGELWGPHGVVSLRADAYLASWTGERLIVDGYGDDGTRVAQLEVEPYRPDPAVKSFTGWLTGVGLESGAVLVQCERY
jgi:hypothetical protein